MPFGRVLVLLFLLVFPLEATISWANDAGDDDPGGENDRGNSSAESDSTRKRFVFFPALFYTPETGIGIGASSIYFLRHARKGDERDRPSLVQPTVVVTTKKQLIATCALNSYWGNAGDWQVASEFGYIHFPDTWYGIGNNTPDDAEENVTASTAFLTLGLNRRLYGVRVGGNFAIQNKTVDDRESGGILDSGSVAGYDGGVTSLLGGLFELDRRNHSFTPNSGQFLQARLDFSHAAFGSDFDYGQFSVDVRQYLATSERTVVALQAFYMSTRGEAPWYSLAQIGGDTIMRGYFAGRYRDNSALAFQAEYRFPVYKRLGAVLFGGVGDVATEPKFYEARDFKGSGGLGVRYMLSPDEKINLRFDFGFARGSSGFYVGIFEAF